MSIKNDGYNYYCYNDIAKFNKTVIKKFITYIKREKLNFTHIACSGASGLMAATLLAEQLNKPIIYIRQPGTRTHGSPIEFGGKQSIKNIRILIIDDFMDTGTTIKRIVNKIIKYYPSLKFVGVYFYSRRKFCTLNNISNYDDKKLFSQKVIENYGI